MSPSKRHQQPARFRIDNEVKVKIIQDYQDGESVDSLTEKYQIPHPEYVRRIIKNVEREKPGDTTRETLPKKTSPQKNKTEFDASSSIPKRSARKRKGNDSAPMEVDDDISFFADSSSASNMFSTSSDSTISSSRQSINPAVEPLYKTRAKARAPQLPSTSVAPIPASRKSVTSMSENTGCQTTNHIFDEDLVLELRNELSNERSQLNQKADALVAADAKIDSLQQQLILKDELIHSKEKEVLLKIQEHEAYQHHVQAWRDGTDRKMKSLEEENFGLKEQIRSRDKEIEGYMRQIDSLKGQLKNKETQIANCQSDLSVKEKELQRCKERIDTLEGNLSSMNDKLGILRCRLHQEHGWNKYF